MKKFLAILAAAMFIVTGCATDQPKTDGEPTPTPTATATTDSKTSPEVTPTPNNEEKHARLEPGEKEEVQLGQTTVKSEWLRTEEPITNDSYSDINGIVSPEKNIIVVGIDKTLTAYRIGKGGLRVEKSYFDNGILKLPFKARLIRCDKNGTIYISGGVFRLATADKKGIVKDDTGAKGYFFPSPDGTWGASCFVASDALVFDNLKGDTFPSKTWFFSNMSDDEKRIGKYSTIDFIDIRDNEFVISGGVAEYKEINGKKQKQIKKLSTCYSKDGKEKYTFERADKAFDPSFIGWVHGSFESKFGNIIIDSNSRTIKMFDKTGKFIGNADLKKVLGASMWPNAVCRIDDSTIAIVGLVDSNDDTKYRETMVYLIKGL